MMKTTWWCDRCGVELVSSDLKFATFEIEDSEAMGRERKHMELCGPCSSDVAASVDAAMAKAGVA